jgi:hypothetical protein
VFRFAVSETWIETCRLCLYSVAAVDCLAETWRRDNTIIISDIEEFIF